MKVSYENLNKALENLGIELQAAELHGQLCGALISSPLQEVENWLFELVGQREQNNIITRQAVEHISSLLASAINQLNDSEFKFGLLLPDADNKVPVKLNALANWCDSFLYGLALGKSKLDKDSASREFMRDLYEIAGVDFAEKTNEQTELAYIELTEYVRMGVLVLQENFRDVGQTSENLQ